MKKQASVILWVLAVSLLGLSCANAQVHWDQDSGRPRSLYQGQTFWNALTESVDEFFGRATGAFLTQSFNGRHTVPTRQWALVATQFLGGGGERGTWNRGTVLDGQWRLYAFVTGSGIPMAFVTPPHDTHVVAAAMTASESGPLPLADLDNAPAFRARVMTGACGPWDAKCQRAAVTIFFEDRFDFDPEIEQVLRKLVSQGLMRECKQLSSDVGSAYLAQYGKPLQCHVRVDITFVDQLPHE